MNKKIKKQNKEKKHNLNTLIKKFNENKTQSLIFIYLILLPIVDVVTAVMTRFGFEKISVGQIIKVLAIAITGIYLLFYSKNRKRNIISVVTLAIFSIVYLINRYLNPYFSFFTEVGFIIRYVHLPIMYLGLIDLLDRKKIDIKIFEKAIIINAITIALILLIASLTKTSFTSYSREKAGNIGWFYAANEISVIVIIGTSFVLKKALENPILIPVYLILMTIFLGVGTKVVVYGLLLVSALLLFWFLFIRKKYYKIIIMLLFVILGIGVLSNYDLIVNDTVKRAINQSNPEAVQKKTNTKKKKSIPKVKQYDSKALTMLNTVLSSRIEFLENTHNSYMESNKLSKFLGIGHVSTEKKPYRDVEMDLFGLFYHFGIIGFILYSIMFAKWIKDSILALKNNYKDFLTTASILSLFMALGIGSIVGHTYFAPAVSIYLAMLASIIYSKLQKKEVEEGKKKKIGIITLHMNFGGVEDATANLANMLKDYYDVTIINMYNLGIAFELDKKINIVQLSKLKPNREEFKKAIKEKNIIKIFKEGFYSLKVLYLRTYLVSKHLLDNNYDIVISTRYLYTKLINYLNINAKKIAIEHKHHNNDKKYINKLKRNTRNLDYLITVSKELKEDYNKILKCKVKYIPNTLDYSLNSRELGIKDKENIIVGVGRLSEEKGFADLIDVFKIINTKFPNYRLVIAGDGKEKENLIKKIEDNNLVKAVSLSGFLNKEDLYKLYEKSEIYLMTSFEESFGIVALEAQAFKLPIITFSSATGVVELLNGTGIVIKNRNKERMAKEAIKLLNNKKIYDNLSKKSYLNAKNYSFEKVQKEWISFLNKI